MTRAHRENPEESTPKVLDLVNGFSKVAEQKRPLYKDYFSLHISNKQPKKIITHFHL